MLLLGGLFGPVWQPRSSCNVVASTRDAIDRWSCSLGTAESESSVFKLNWTLHEKGSFLSMHRL